MRLSASSLALAITLGTSALAASAPAAAQDYRYGDRYENRSDYGRGGFDSAELQRAVDRCVYAAERERDRVDAVDVVRRTRDGWNVSGRMDNGNSWSCEIDDRGRIRDIEFDRSGYGSRGDYGYGESNDDYRYDDRRDNGRYDYDDNDRGADDYRYDNSGMPAPSSDGEWTAEDYARARARTQTPADGPYTYGDAPLPRTNTRSPTYPGGPMREVDPDDGYGLDSVSGPG